MAKPIARIWTKTWFRYLAFAGARTIGHLWRRLTTGWTGFLTLLIAVMAGLWLVRWLHSLKPTANPWPWWLAWLASEPVGPWQLDFFELLTLSYWAKALAVTGVIVLIIKIVRDRRHLTILPVVNNAGDDFKSMAAGLPSRLATELRLLSELYQTIDDANPRPDVASSQSLGAGLPLYATVEVGDAAESLAKLIPADTDIQIASFRFPLGRLISTIDRQFPGPRLSSSLHRVGNELILSVRFEGRHRKVNNWSLQTNIAGAATPLDLARALEVLLDQLVYRILASVEDIGSKDWQAVKSFSQGLRAYRRTLVSGRDKILNLRRAERFFIEARAYDKDYTQCSYNLGIVYRELKEDAAAKVALETAINENPGNSAAAYALALIYWQEEKYDKAALFAERALHHNLQMAEAWDLEGLATRQLMLQEEKRPRKSVVQEKDWHNKRTYYNDKFISCHEQAAALCWRHLCHSAFHGRSLDGPRKAIKKPFANLASARAIVRDLRISIGTLRQALWQIKRSEELYYELGFRLRAWSEFGWRYRLKSHYLRRSVSAYDKAVRCATRSDNRAVYHAYLAHAAAKLFANTANRYDFDTAIDAFDQATQCPSSLPAHACKELRLACRLLKDRERERLAKCFSVAPWKKGKHNRLAVPALENRLEKLEHRNSKPRDLASQENRWQSWDYAFVAMELARKLSIRKHDGDARRVAKLAIRGIRAFATSYPKEIARQRAYSFLAWACFRIEKPRYALWAARKAVESNPWDAEARLFLGDAYLALKDYDRAEEAYRTSAEINPGDGQASNSLANLHFNRGLQRRNRDERRADFAQIIGLFNNLLVSARTSEDHGRVHYWLGAFHGELMNYDKALHHLLIARSYNFRPLSTRFQLGWAYLDLEAYDEAQKCFREAIRKSRPYRKAGSPWHEGKAPGEEEPTGFLVLRVILMLALACGECKPDRRRARTLLEFVRRNRRSYLSNKQAGEFENQYRQEIDARYLDYLGWIDYRDRRFRHAVGNLKKSAAIRVSAENYYHLAQVTLDQCERYKLDRRTRLNEAREYCRKARGADFQGLFDGRIDAIETRLTKLETPSRTASKSN
jgi:tetratricopeptide (TPR) repeat protein